MKRILIFLLLALLLSGCAASPAENTTSPTVPTAAEEPGLYDPDSALELQTGGAVKAYPLDENTYSSITCVDGGLLLHSRDDTRLTLVTGVNLVPAVQKDFSFHAQHIQSGPQGIACWYPQADCIIFLSPALQETGRLLLPDDLIGTPWLTSGWDALYYCTAAGLRCLDLESGISRPVIAQDSQQQTVTGIFCSDTVVRCVLTQEDGSLLTRMICCQTGQILWEGSSLLEFTAAQDNWFARIDRGSIQELLFSCEEDIRSLWLSQTLSGIFPIPEQNAVLAYLQTDQGTQVYYYNLSTGLCTASVMLEDITALRDVCTDENGESLWLLASSQQTSTDLLCRWTPGSESSDKTVYTQPYYTRAQPDTQGMQALQAQVKVLEQTHGVELLLGDAALAAAEGVTVQTEYLIPAYELYLPRIMHLLNTFPDGFFNAVAQNSASGVVHIALVRSFQADAGSLPVYFSRQDGELYLMLALDDSLEEHFYHGVCHFMETRLLSSSAALYGWGTLNPPGFAYDNDYRQNLNRDNTQYLQGEDRAFTDVFAMSYAREDRAQVLQYACTPGNEAMFSAPILQSKLAMLCSSIREVFQLDGSSYLWEQYLTNEPQ